MTVPVSKTQDPSDTLIWTFDWTDELATNGGTITSAIVIGSDVTMLITGKTVASPLVTVKLACPAVPVGTEVALTCQATLSTTEVQSKTHYITIEER